MSCSSKVSRTFERFFTERILLGALSAKIVIKGRQNSNLLKLLERDTDHMACKSYILKSALCNLPI